MKDTNNQVYIPEFKGPTPDWQPTPKRFGRLIVAAIFTAIGFSGCLFLVLTIGAIGNG